ncbi:MAG: hypothetical protein ACI9QC_000396 [Oceanicoccus sp.]|jgi:hypothetical protein
MDLKNRIKNSKALTESVRVKLLTLVDTWDESQTQEFIKLFNSAELKVSSVENLYQDKSDQNNQAYLDNAQIFLKKTIPMKVRDLESKVQAAESPDDILNAL